MGTRERRQKEKRLRRDEILDAAEKIFLAKGYENATMDDVAARAELGKGTLYIYYRSKEELYLGINARAARKLVELFSEAVASGTTGIDKVRLIGEAYLKFATEYPSYFDSRLHFENRTIESFGNLPGAREYFETSARISVLVAGAVAEGIRDGSIRAGLQPETTGMLLWALSSGFAQFVMRREDVVNRYFTGGRAAVVAAFFDFMIHALKPLKS